MHLMFYHIKNLQSTKTVTGVGDAIISFITLRIYKVLKLNKISRYRFGSFITLRIYKVLKLLHLFVLKCYCFITLRIYKVLKPQQRLYALIHS